jgi:hypothetical protein
MNDEVGHWALRGQILSIIGCFGAVSALFLPWAQQVAWLSSRVERPVQGEGQFEWNGWGLASTSPVQNTALLSPPVAAVLLVGTLLIVLLSWSVFVRESPSRSAKINGAVVTVLLILSFPVFAHLHSPNDELTSVDGFTLVSEPGIAIWRMSLCSVFVGSLLATVRGARTWW